MLQCSIRRTKPVRGFQRLWGLGLVAAVGKLGNDGIIERLYIFSFVARWRFHHILRDVAADVVLGSRDGFHDFSHGPAVGSGFEVPLSGGKSLGGVDHALLSALQVLHSLVFVCLGLGKCRAHQCQGECQTRQISLRHTSSNARNCKTDKRMIGSVDWIRKINKHGTRPDASRAACYQPTTEEHGVADRLPLPKIPPRLWDSRAHSAPETFPALRKFHGLTRPMESSSSLQPACARQFPRQCEHTPCALPLASHLVQRYLSHQW